MIPRPPIGPLLQGALPKQLATGLDTFHRAANHLLVVAHRYEMYQALGRSADFVRRIHGTSCAPGLNTLRGALLASLVVSVTALFDQSEEATSLTRALNSLLIPGHAEMISAHHGKFSRPFDSCYALGQLKRLRSRLSRQPFQVALRRLTDLRRRDLAHLDRQPSFPAGRALTGDLDLVYATAVNITVKGYRFLGGDIKSSDIRAEARV